MKHETWECDRCGMTSPSTEGWHMAGARGYLDICNDCWIAMGSPSTECDRNQLMRRLLRQDYQRQPRDDWSRDGVAGTGVRTELDWQDERDQVVRQLKSRLLYAWEIQQTVPLSNDETTFAYFNGQAVAYTRALRDLGVSSEETPAAHDDGPGPNVSTQQDSTAAVPAAREGETDG